MILGKVMAKTLIRRAVVIGVLVFIDSQRVEANAKKNPNFGQGSFDGKKVIALSPLKNTQIEMPDQSIKNFGEDFSASLVTLLIQTQKYFVSEPQMSTHDSFHDSSHDSSDVSVRAAGQYFVWAGSVTPSVKLRVRVDALSFQTGARGDRMFYGFDEKFRNPFNSGDGIRVNEFPLKVGSTEPSWFGNSFIDKGKVPFDSRSGLDLGDGFQINFLFAWLTMKYAEYHSYLHLRLYLSHPTASLNGVDVEEFHDINVSGRGYFFDASGAYANYSAGITVARKDAMSQALNHAIQGSLSEIESVLDVQPLMAKVDAIVPSGLILLGTGPYSQVRPGVLYAAATQPEFVLQVISSGESGSLASVVSGNLSSIKAGAIVRQVHSISEAHELALVKVQSDLNIPETVRNVTLPSLKFPKINLPAVLNPVNWAPVWTEVQAFFKSIEGAIFLPYRVYRYFSYDQNYHARADVVFVPHRKGFQAWEKQIGLDQAPQMKSVGPIVAIIDSGVDYNHPQLHGSIWKSDGNQPGWDFISNDSRPYDDHYHGTQLASLVVKVAPRAKIMPIKIFNPWGITTSASILAGFQFAVDHRAEIILCGWKTSVPSQALQMGISYAKDHGVLVVTAAGDDGFDLAHLLAFPAEFSTQFDNVLVVTGVDSHDKITQVPGKIANFGANQVQIAAPGQDIAVAEPLGGVSVETSTGLAAAIVAGALARVEADSGSDSRNERDYHDVLRDLLRDSIPVPQLQDKVRQGLRLQIRR